jgi:hypothetical protein
MIAPQSPSIRVRLLGGALLLLTLVVCADTAHAQIVAAGDTLTVTTTNMTATFAGPDLVGIVNTATGGRFLTNPSQGELASINAFSGNGQPLQASNWTPGTEPGTGHPTATIATQSPGRTLTLTVKIDPATQEIVLRLNASVSAPGLREASWSLAGLDIDAGRLIVPGHTGVVYDRSYPGVGSYLQYPNTWQAQMAVFESPAGSLLLYSTDQQYRHKRLYISSRGNSSIDLAVVTEAVAPFGSASAVPSVEWRLRATPGDWRTAAAVYRTWLAVNRPPVSPAAHPWVSNTRAVVRMPPDAGLLGPLAAQVTPAQTLLYIHDWRRDAYDVNYPDYTPRAGVASFIASARALGFRVMLHIDLIGVSPSNADYASVQAHQVREPETLARMGWKWDLPPSTPHRFAFINPSSAVFRSLLLARLGAMVAAVNPDALHLDISAPMYNDGNGPIEGMNYAQGSARLHEELIARFPSLALGGEGENDVISRYHSFAQAWYTQLDDPGHPITTFLFDPHVQYYGHLSLASPSDPAFQLDLLRLQERAILPHLSLDTVADLDTTNPDSARVLAMLRSWQLHGFKPAWTANWGPALVRYEGSGAVAEFTRTASEIALTAAGAALFRIAHRVEQIATPAFVNGWPAFDGTTLYGLDRRRKYFLDSVARPANTHLTFLPSGLRLAGGTLVGPNVAHVEIARSAPESFDFTGGLIRARTGVRYQGADAPLSHGALVQLTSIVAGGAPRSGIFMHPPFLAQIGGETFVEYIVPVPAAATLSFSVAVADNASCTDGVTFRVMAGTTELWRRDVERTGWQDARLDLALYAGTTIALRLATTPGPAGQPNCDWALWSNLVMEATPSAMLFDVPVTLAGGSSLAGFDGDGALSSTSPLTVTVRNLSVPASFTLFTGPGTPVVAGTNLLAVTPQVWHAASDMPAQPGAVFGSGGIVSATSGGVTRSQAYWAHPPYGQTVLGWVLRLPASPALRLGWSAGLSDAGISDDGVDFIVRINGVPYWRSTIATGGWRPGTLDLSRWKDQNVLVELVTDSRSNFLFDHAHWADLAVSASTVTCTYAVPPTVSVLPAGGQFSLNVSASATCPWSTSSNVPWMTITAGTGVGAGTVTYNIAPNAAGTRVGRLTIAGQPVTVTQVSASLFTDDPLTSSVTPIRAVHISELRQRIDALRARQGLGPYPWRDQTLSAASTPIRAAHIIDLRAAVLQVYAARGSTAPTFTDSIVSGTPMRAAHIGEIRAAVLAIE